MLDELLGVEVPDDISNSSSSRAEGNPFFVEELVGELVDVGVLERSDGAWALAIPHPATRSRTRSTRSSPPASTDSRR